MKNNFELLAPAGDMEKLKTALHFGADAVYFAGKKFGLRAFASNFEDLAEPINYCHERGKKAYITINGNGNFYVLTNRVQKFISDAQRFFALEPIDPSAKK